MTDPFAAAAAAIDAAFAETVTYLGDGFATPTDLTVIWSDEPGDSFEGAGNTTRRITAEIRKEKLSQRPSKAGRLTRKGITYKPQQVTEVDTVEAWTVVLERA